MIAADIEIIDVIHHYHQYSKTPQVFVVISRDPEWIYAKEGNNLAAHDGGFYDFMQIEPGTKDAFAGREFDIKLTDGTLLHCAGQVWASGTSTPPEPMISVGCASIAALEKCYVFSGAKISKAKYDDWMTKNTPSHDYYKYDLRSSLSYHEKLYRDYPDWDHPVSPKRARTLRKRGVTIRRHPMTGKPGWSPNFERKKAEILVRTSPDYKGRFHPEASK